MNHKLICGRLSWQARRVLVVLIFSSVFPSVLLAHPPPPPPPLECCSCCIDGCTEGDVKPEMCKEEAVRSGGDVGGSSGNVYTERGEFYQRAVDLSIPGRPGAGGMLHYAFRRHYRSRRDTNTPLGRNWNHNYFERLSVQSNGSVVHDNGLARNDRYRKNAQGGFGAPPELFTELSQNADGSFTLRYLGGTEKLFGTNGKLLEIRDRNDNVMRFQYDASNRLAKITDTLGRNILYRYFPNGRLQEIEDFIGRKVKFLYDGNGDLIEVTSPAVTGTPNRNDFPNGKTTRYSYSSGFADARLNHNLLAITRPNEVATGGAPLLTNEYGTASVNFDRVTRQTYGGTNASGIAAGGQFTFTYTARPGAGLDATLLRTRVTDRNGNEKEYEFNGLGYPLASRELTNRDVRPDDPDVYETSMGYNADGRLTSITYPEGNRIEYTYDSANPNRLAQGNLLIENRIPDAARGGAQAALITSYTYEARFNRIKTITDARGNDPSFVPPNGGSPSPERYTTVYTFDYEVAGDPELNPGGFEHGNIVRKQEPTVRLPDGSPQEILTDYAYNRFGQKVREIDPEGNVDELFYFPENDPDGDGIASAEPGLATDTGGYLEATLIDSTTSPRRTEATPPVGINNRWFYDPVGNIIRTIDGRGNDTIYFVNQLNQVVRTQSELPFRYIQDTVYDFNDNVIGTAIENRVARVRDGKPRFTGDGNFRIRSGTPRFFIHRYRYDILDNLIEKDEDASGSAPSRLITRYRYDANENRIQEIFPAGNTFAAEYDERDLLFTQTRGFGSPEASTFTYAYDPNRNQVSMLDGEDNNGDGQTDERVEEYDGFDRQVRSSDAVGNETQKQYDPVDNVVLESRLGRVGGPSPTDNSGTGNVLLSQREFKHDELNRLFQQDDSLFISQRVATVGTPELTEGPLTPGDAKVSMRYLFDRNSRKQQEIQDDLDTTRTEYDGVDRVVKTTDPEANRKSYTYDDNHNTVQVVETEISQKAGIPTETFTTTQQYDTLDRLTRMTDNCGNTNRSAYDSRNNVTHTTDAQANDTAGCSGTVNAQGNSMRYVYDGMNRRLRVVQDLRVGGIGAGALDTSNPFNPDGRIVGQSRWDGNSRQIRLTDDKGNPTSYSYDALNRRTLETFADGTTKHYGYDRDDNLIQAIDNIGTLQDCRFDAINRRTRCDITPALGVVGTTLVTSQYDGLSRMTRAADDNEPGDSGDDSIVTMAYDSLSRLIEEVQNGEAITGDWFGQERRIGLTYPNGRQLQSAFDGLDRLSLIQDGTGAIAEYDYIGPGRVLERRHANGTRLSYLDDAGTADIGYDGVKRAVTHRHLRADNSLVVGFAHAYDREDNKRFEEKLHNPASSELYAYDSPYRLTDFERGQLTPTMDGIVNPQKTQEWDLDGVGNWRVNTVNAVPENRTVNEMNEYVSVDATATPHDDNGNLLDDGKLTFQWDYQNRLRTATRKSDGALIAVYAYDGLNRRIRKVITSSGLDGTSEFFYDGWRVLEERDGVDVLVQQYVYGGVYVDEPLVLDRNLDSDDSAIGPGDERLFYHQNTLYSVFALTDQSGAVVESHQYDAYGAPSSLSGRGNPYMFTGQRLDAETDLMYYKNRYYSVGLGRFMQRDPKGYVDGMNLYEYVKSNPLNRLDPHGLNTETVTIEHAVIPVIPYKCTAIFEAFDVNENCDWDSEPQLESLVCGAVLVVSIKDKKDEVKLSKQFRCCPKISKVCKLYNCYRLYLTVSLDVAVNIVDLQVGTIIKTASKLWCPPGTKECEKK